jgi:hypothetical protein
VVFGELELNEWRWHLRRRAQGFVLQLAVAAFREGRRASPTFSVKTC